jgi:hypothetical protein
VLTAHCVEKNAKLNIIKKRQVKENFTGRFCFTNLPALSTFAFIAIAKNVLRGCHAL